MANYTPIVKLLKPLETDKYDVNLRNENWQKIDDFFGSLQNALKTHRELNELDHPDSSVTTPKLRDKAVTTPKLAEKSVTASKLADDINQKLNNDYVQKIGDTMSGDLSFNKGVAIKFKNGNQVHSIGNGGRSGENLDLGSFINTNQTFLCCQNRPGWYAGENTSKGGSFLTYKDIAITTGIASDGEEIPIPQGFNRNECHVLVTMRTSNKENIYVDIRESGISTSIQSECWYDSNSGRVHVGTWFRNVEGYSHSAYGGSEGRGDKWMPGEVNYLLIAKKPE